MVLTLVPKAGEERLGGMLAAWVDRVQRRAGLVAIVDAAVTALLAVFVLTHLGVNMDNKRLLDPDLPFQRAAAVFRSHFGSLDDALLIVVDAETPGGARAAAAALAERLRAQPATFADVYVPGGEPFFRERALLYRSVEELDDFTDHLARMQPIVAELSHDPTVASLARLIEDALAAGVEADEREWAGLLDRIRQATVRVFDDYPLAISWEDLMVEGSALDPGTRQVIVAEPVLEFGALLAAAGPIEAIRAAARALDLESAHGARVRVTGNPALNYEEMFGLAWDVGVASAGSFALVTGILYLAFRSLRIVSAAALTLLVGLIWTAAFAALAVGDLNVASIAFGVLFIGLGIDFAIHLGIAYVEEVRGGAPSDRAMGRATARLGSSLVLCALTTAIGFFAFVPADYRGVAELGLISGAGMFVILAQTVTLFPALVALLVGDTAAARVGARPRRTRGLPALAARRPRTVACLAGLVGLAALVPARHLRFDSNVVAMRDPRTESVRAFDDLLADSATSPWYVDVLARDLEGAVAAAAALREVPTVERAITLRDYVPSGQEEKLEILADAAFLLDTPPRRAPARDAPTVAEQIAALARLHEALGTDVVRDEPGPLAASARRLRDEIGRFRARVAREADPAPALAALERVLLGDFPAQVRRLRRALAPAPITLEALPPRLTRRMLAPDGHARVQVFPREALGHAPTMARFVDTVRRLEPDATGVSVNLVEFGRATARSLRDALLLAFVAIAALLFALWRRVAETALVLAPLALAGALTGALMVVTGTPFNFANVIVLPLLLGVGVDSGIHLVHRARGMVGREEGLLETTTARAVLFSAVTTIASFGSLALSGHRGLASMGVLLVVGMALTLVANLVVLPTLLALWLPARPRASP